jgi:hypothetical protein
MTIGEKTARGAVSFALLWGALDYWFPSSPAHNAIVGVIGFLVWTVLDVEQRIKDLP